MSTYDLPEEVPALRLCEGIILRGDSLEKLAALQILRQNHALLLALQEGGGNYYHKIILYYKCN